MAKEAFKTMIGGQALIEGIMMRGPETDAIVVRTKDGLTTEVIPRKTHPKTSPLSWPGEFLRCSDRGREGADEVCGFKSGRYNRRGLQV